MFALTKPEVRTRHLDTSITPLINIVFLLLLFFIVAGNLKNMDIAALPHSKSAHLAELNSSVLILLRTGELRWQKQPTSLDELVRVLSDLDTDMPMQITLQADAQVTTHYLVPVLNALQALDIGKIIVITVNNPAE